MGSTVNNILIVGPSWVGDMVMAQTLFIVLKQQHPAANIDVLAPKWSQPLLAAMPQIRRALDLPLAHGEVGFRSRYRLGLALRGQYQLAILLPNSWKSALIPWFANIPQRRGWLGEMRYGLLNDARKLDKAALPLLIQRFAALAIPAGAELPTRLPFPALQLQTVQIESTRQVFALPAEQPLLALCPGAEFGPAKRWPERHYAEVARQMIDRGWRICLLGSASDRTVTDTIFNALGTRQEHCLNLAGSTSLEQAMCVLSVASAVVSNDSGLMHIAAALQRPLVAVYGSSSPDFTPPLATAVEKLLIPVDCGPCFKRDCPLGHKKCLEELPPARVLAALQNLQPA